MPPPPQALRLFAFAALLAGLAALPRPAGAVVSATVSEAAAQTPEAAFVSRIREAAAGHRLLRRPHSLASLRADTAFRMKYREKPAHLSKVDEAGWERFALALADAEAARDCARLLPALARAARLSGDPQLTALLRAQTAELVSWAPLQRGGWAGGSSEPGSWLGTGWGVRALVLAVREAPADMLSSSLQEALVARLDAEIALVREDWETKRTWFTRIDAVSSNQWVLPLEGVLLASVHAGLDRHREDYEFAVAGLLRTMDAQGVNGECVEGMQYGGITFDSLLTAARIAREAGDERLARHPWLRAFPRWYLHHRQPGGQVINAFDSQVLDLDWTLVARMAAELDDPGARWALLQRPVPDSVPPDLALALLDLALRPGPAAPPPLFFAYPVATRVNWLENASAFLPAPAHRVSGFWMRGGHPSDAHDHEDRGHLSFTVAGRPVLIEAGLFSYGSPDHPSRFKSVAGHNVLELLPADARRRGGQRLDPAHRSAPMTVHRLDPAGGEVSVDATGCYAGLQGWIRRAAWNATTVSVEDTVTLAEPQRLRFRWHLGEPAGAPVRQTPGMVQVGDTLLVFQTPDSTALTVTVEPMPDHTLRPGAVHSHATVVIESAQAITALSLHTCISLAPSPDDRPHR